MPNSLSQNILATICYYDVLDYPLTVFELWKYLISDPAYAEASAYVKASADKPAGKCEAKKVILAEVVSELENEALQKNIEKHLGFYFLAGRKSLVTQRLERNKLAEKKYRRVRRAVWFLRFVPFVRSVAVAGRLAMKNVETQSDLDLLIVLKSGHIFTGRMLVTAVVQASRMRRHGKKIANRICLNHFLTDEFNVGVQDLFSAHEYTFARPIFKPEVFGRLYQKNNWIEKYKPNYLPEKDNLKIIKDSFISRCSRNILEKCLAFPVLEKFLQKIQTEKIAKNALTEKKGAMIICSRDELAFWPNFENQGPRVFGEFKARMEGLTKF
jgi:hypothetical protein